MSALNGLTSIRRRCYQWQSSLSQISRENALSRFGIIWISKGSGRPELTNGKSKMIGCPLGSKFRLENMQATTTLTRSGGSPPSYQSSKRLCPFSIDVAQVRQPADGSVPGLCSLVRIAPRRHEWPAETGRAAGLLCRSEKTASAAPAPAAISFLGCAVLNRLTRDLG